MEYIISDRDLQKILDNEREATVITTLALLGIKPDRVSENKARKIVGGRAKLETCKKEGIIKGITNGKGKTSTILYPYAQLMTIRNSDKITIYKSNN
ncbi:MAG: hypothetical protein LBN95_03850 [Prevotellaceae bacterium]|jgi:hypothetical protein|nr:hypothetical protein [Prevotellaceae bacterium]